VSRRARANIRAEFRCGALRGTGQIRNLSRDGLFVGTDVIPEEGATVQARFDSPRGDPVRLVGLVWWTSRGRGACPLPGFGMRLLGANEAYRELVRTMLG
jgi:hypothetical protein